MLEARGGRSVVVTGLGVLAPCGTGVDEFWAGLAKPIEPARVRGIPAFDASRWGLDHIDVRRLDRFAQLAVAAAAQALADAGLVSDVADRGALAGVDGDRVGVNIGSAIGGGHSWEKQVLRLRDKGERHVSPLTIPMGMSNSGAAAVAMRWRLSGPCETVSTACASGTHSIIAGARWIAAGHADIVITGGAESPTNPTNAVAFANMRALSPSGVSRPFDADRDGFCASEAAGVVVLEEASHAASRGAHAYMALSGAGSTSDAHHITAPAPDGRGALRCMRLALGDAGLEPADITHINAHGSSTPLNDAVEAAAIRDLFGTHRPAITAIKGATGHALGASGALETVALALTYRHRTIPPTSCVENVDPTMDIDLVREARPWLPGPCLSNSFGFGGHNGTLAFTPVS